MNYTYDNNGNVLTKTSPLPNQSNCSTTLTTSYSYDALNRLTQKSYSDGTTPAHYYYDTMPWWWGGIPTSNAIGRLTSEGTSVDLSTWPSARWFGYDPMGRISSDSQWSVTNGTRYTVPYSYDLIGGMTSYGYGGLTLTQGVNAAGLPTGVTSSIVDSQHPATLVSGVHYNGAGEMTAATLGNGLTETAAYNPRLQPCRQNVNSSGTALGACTDAVPSGNVLDLNVGFNYGSGDNGNVMGWSATGAAIFNRSYTYDGVNRLSTMSAPGDQCTGLSWSYDAWGNRAAQTPTGGTCNAWSASYNSSNQPTNPGFAFDAAGNMTNDGSHSYTYDAENRLTQVDGGSTATYVYDAEGQRVQRTTGGATTSYVYDLAGHVIAEYGCATCWNVGYVYLNGALSAVYKNGTTYFAQGDHLGSTRLLTGYPTPSIIGCKDYYPFGELISCGSDVTTHKFTGKERDTESNLDNFFARYYSSSQSRFMSPDPANAGADPSNPQSWNGYSYVTNNPLSMIDPTGTCGTTVVWGPTIIKSHANGTIEEIATGDLVSTPCPGASPVRNPNPTIGLRVTAPQYPQSPGFWQRTQSVNQCAASTANKYSVAALTHTQNLPVAGSLFSNYFSSASQLAFGPNRAGGAGSLTTNAASFGVGPSGKAAGAIPVSSGYQFLFSSTPATAFAETTVGKVTLGAVGAVSASLTYEAVGQFFYDAAAYATSLVTCSIK